MNSTSSATVALSVAVNPGVADPLAPARGLSDAFSSRAAEGDAGRTMPADLADRVRGTGLFAMSRTRCTGGLELDLSTQAVVLEELARGDGSFGWSMMIAAGAGTAFAWLDPPVATALLGDDPWAAASLMAGPIGTATPTAHGYRITGRWPFVTGCLHAEWHIVAVRIPGVDGPHRHFAFLSRRDTTVIDTWDGWGLRGTGSHDVVVDDIYVPAEHVVAPTAAPARHDSQLARVPFWTQLAVGHAAFSLGVARRGLDEFAATATAKHRGAAQNTVAETGEAQLALGQAEATLQAARAFVLDICAAIDAVAASGDTPDLDQRTRMLLAALNAQRAAETAVDSVLPFAGAGVLCRDSALHRSYRDLHAAGQHIFLSADAWKRCAARYLNLPQPAHLL